MGILKYALIPLGPVAWPAAYLVHRHEKKDEAKRIEAFKRATTYQPYQNLGGFQHWATDDELSAAGKFRKIGTSIGLTLNSKREIFTGDKSPHRISFGTTSDGKTSHVLQALVGNSLRKTSVIAPDIAGEIACMGGRFRQTCGDVRLVNPLGMMRKRLGGLPLGFVDPMRLEWLNPVSRYFWARSYKLAANCISRGSYRDPYWGMTTRELKQFGIMSVRSYFPSHLAKLPVVARLLCDDPCHFAQWVMRRCDDPRIAHLGARWANPRAADGSIRSASEVIENLRSEVSFLLDDGVAEIFMRPPTFSFQEAKRRVMTILFLLPGEVLDGPLVKLFKFLTGTCFSETLRFDARDNNPIQLILDELAMLDLDDFGKLMATGRKFQVHVWGLLQDAGQLKEMTGGGNGLASVLGNAGAIQVLGIGPGDVEGGEMVSAMIGQAEVAGYSRSISYHGGGIGGEGWIPSWRELSQIHVSDSYQQQSRRLLLGQEVRFLDPNLQILFLDGVESPVLARKAPFYQTSAKRRVQPSPYWKG